jgi:hypothetical protein
MSRYVQTYRGARRTAALHVQLTPDERSALEDAARKAGAVSLSAFVRFLCLRGMAEPEPAEAVAPPSAEARRLIYELNAVGNNLNQLARKANTAGDLAADELRATTGLLKAALARAIAL